MTSEQVRHIEITEHIRELEYFLDRCLSMNIFSVMNLDVRDAQRHLKTLADLI